MRDSPLLSNSCSSQPRNCRNYPLPKQETGLLPISPAPSRRFSICISTRPKASQAASIRFSIRRAFPTTALITAGAGTGRNGEPMRLTGSQRALRQPALPMNASSTSALRREPGPVNWPASPSARSTSRSLLRSPLSTKIPATQSGLPTVKAEFSMLPAGLRQRPSVLLRRSFRREARPLPDRFHSRPLRARKSSRGGLPKPASAETGA